MSLAQAVQLKMFEESLFPGSNKQCFDLYNKEIKQIAIEFYQLWKLIKKEKLSDIQVKKYIYQEFRKLYNQLHGFKLRIFSVWTNF